ncbi:BTB and MATH domain-containing protein 41 [Borealophlyctis nickersoniae]|nr:BTB and MATH domain-containing protein 41 [Borealophlyctis nickersoniae]
MNTTENIVEETFNWIITDYDRARIQDVNEKGVLRSTSFGSSEQPWRLHLFTKGTKEITTHLGLFLEAVKSPQEEQDRGWKRSVRMELKVKKRQGVVESITALNPVYDETELNLGWGTAEFVEKEKIAQEYLQSDGSFHIICKIRYERFPGIRLLCTPPTHRALLLSEELSDTKIVTGDEVSIPAHKALLYPCEYFRALFSFNLNQSGDGGKIIKSHFSSTVIRSMLEFLYTGYIITYAPQTFEERCDLVRLADMYHLPNLHALIAQLIIAKDLTNSNAEEILKFAHKYGEGPGCGLLRDACLQVVRQKLKTSTLQPEGYGKWILSLCPKLFELLYANPGAEVEAEAKEIE